MIVERGVGVRAHYDRSPATIKGAFVLRGEDPDPHQVRIHGARVVAVGRDQAWPMGLRPAVVDVAPRRDLFVPFEFPTVDLEPGWYGLEIELEVDGHPARIACGRRFSVPWPRAAVRRGQVRVAKLVSTGGARVAVERLDLLGDSLKLRLTAEGPELPPLRLSADGEPVPIVEQTFDAGRREATVVAYPLLRSQGRLRIEVGRGRERGVLEVPLP
ncbi:MAG TPA: hypothetical protein VNP94_01985 [Actinomycetota bacterium]|nr:hypothetical protein [Actinomycetota bacterium]